MFVSAIVMLRDQPAGGGFCVDWIGTSVADTKAAIYHRFDCRMRTILFACVHNAGRSQMAAAFFNAQADPSLARALSAGTEPGPRVHPEVVEAMYELGIDLSEAVPQRLSDAIARDASLLITMGCGEACPAIPGLAIEDWPLPDPKGQSIDAVRAIRDELRTRVAALIAKQSWGR